MLRTISEFITCASQGNVLQALVTCAGTWGLTRGRSPTPVRRVTSASLARPSCGGTRRCTAKPPRRGRTHSRNSPKGSKTPDLDKSQSSDSFGQEMSVTLLPVSVKFPVRPTGNSTEFDSSADSYCKLRSMIQHPNAANPEKLGVDSAKLLKAQA